MGQNFALNIASRGFTTCVGNKSQSKVAVTLKRAEKEGHLPVLGSSSPEDFVKKLKRPRKVILLVQAGKPVHDTITTLSGYMDKGDILIDGGNEWCKEKPYLKAYIDDSVEQLSISPFLFCRS